VSRGLGRHVPPQEDELHDLLLDRVSKNAPLTVTDVGAIARLASRGGYAPESATSQRLAKLNGRTGRWTQNAERSLHRYQRRRMKEEFQQLECETFLTPYELLVPMKRMLHKRGESVPARKNKTVKERLPCLFPSAPVFVQARKGRFRTLFVWRLRSRCCMPVVLA